MKPSIESTVLACFGLLCAACSAPQSQVETANLQKSTVANGCINVDFTAMQMTNNCNIPMEVGILWNPFGQQPQQIVYRVGAGQGRPFAPRGQGSVVGEGPVQENLGADVTGEVHVIQVVTSYYLRNDTGKYVFTKWGRQGEPVSAPPNWILLHEKPIPIDTVGGPFTDVVIKAEIEPD